MKMKIVTLNLWFGGILFEEIVEFLRKENPDVVTMQEVYRGQDPLLTDQFRSIQVLKERLGCEFADFAPDYRDYDEADGKAQRGNGILSKFRIVSHDALYYDQPYSEEYRDLPGQYHLCPHNLQHIVLDTPAGKVDVFNVHGPWDLNGDDYGEARQKMNAAIVTSIQLKNHVILAGDTNATQNNRLFKNIDQYLKNPFAGELTTTYNMRHKTRPGYATAVVDVIYVSPHINVAEHSCPDVDISDHLPLVATLEIPQQ